MDQGNHFSFTSLVIAFQSFKRIKRISVVVALMCKFLGPD